jgi:hypothetical protein
MLVPDGWRYPLVGGTRQRRFDGINFKPCKPLENAQTPTIVVLVHFQGSGAHPISLKKQGPIGVCCEWQTRSRTLALVSLRDSRGAPWLPITMIYQLVTP